MAVRARATAHYMASRSNITAMSTRRWLILVGRKEGLIAEGGANSDDVGLDGDTRPAMNVPPLR
jgi:hypothetical protein